MPNRYVNVIVQHIKKVNLGYKIRDDSYKQLCNIIFWECNCSEHRAQIAFEEMLDRASQAAQENLIEQFRQLAAACIIHKRERNENVPK